MSCNIPEGYEIKWNDRNNSIFISKIGETRGIYYSAADIFLKEITPCVVGGYDREELNKKYKIHEKGFLNIIPELKADGYCVIDADDLIQSDIIPSETAQQWQRHADEVKKLSDAIGFIRRDDSDECFLKNNEITKKWPTNRLSPYLQRITAEIGRKEGTSEWIAQFGYRCSIEDYNIEGYFFNHEPSPKDLDTAIDIKSLKSIIAKKGSPIIECIDCGREVHWADIRTDSLKQKLDWLEESYCGC